MCAMPSSLMHWGLNKMTTLCAIFLKKLPDSKFQIELTNGNCCSSFQLKRISLVWVMVWYRRGDRLLPEPKMTKATLPVGVALDVSGSPYRNSMGLPAISRAASTGRSHRMSYGAAFTISVWTLACPVFLNISSCTGLWLYIDEINTFESFKDQVPVRQIYGCLIFKWFAETLSEDRTPL